ncbi:MAG TPA: glycosyltransferase family 4 protein [Sphingomicrobium sp.]|nr:glycosyltransferase family 4 protein [Sphingomicrobium sp.]
MPSDAADRSTESGRRPLQLAYVANSRIPSRAANTVHVLNMSEAFAAEGHSVSLIARGEPPTGASLFEDFSLENRFDVKLLPVTNPAFLDRLCFIRHVRRSLAERPFDFVYGRSCYGLLAGVPRNVPFAYDLHIVPSSRLRRGLEALLFRRPNFLFATAITRAIADKYRSTFPHLRDRILVAPCAAAPVQQATECRQPGPTRVYYVGHLYQGRGIDLVLEVARAATDIEFHIVGGEEADIRFWAGRASENVVFHGYVKPSGLAAHYERADLCVAPHGTTVTVAGGGGDIAPWMSPMKIFEYMAHGKPLIAADLPALREIVSPGVDGLLCPPDDPEAWLGAIRILSNDAALRGRLGEAARRTLEEHHTWQGRARAILEFAEVRTVAERKRVGLARDLPSR